MIVKMSVVRLIPGGRKGRHYISQAQNEAKCSGGPCGRQDHSQTLAAKPTWYRDDCTPFDIIRQSVAQDVGRSFSHAEYQQKGAFA